MTKLLFKILIKDYENVSSPAVRTRYGIFSSVLGTVMNIILAGLKLCFGLLSGSIAITADALNNFSDAASSVITYVSFKISSKPADRKHPFGHARIEYICSMIVSFLILVVGFELFSDSISRLINYATTTVDFELVTFIILGCSIVVKLWLAYINNKVGKNINSSVIKASSMDALMDAISTSAVLVSGIIVKFTGLHFIDSIMGILVSFLIFFAGAKILNETKNSLLGEAAGEDVINSIREIAEKYPDIVGIHDMMIHNYGPDKYIASFHAEVDGSKDIYMLHDTIDNIEREINDKTNILCTIHMDPIVTDDKIVCELREFAKDTVKELYPEAHIHDFRIVVGITHTNLIFDIVIPFEEKTSDDEIASKVSAEILSKRENHYCVITIDRA